LFLWLPMISRSHQWKTAARREKSDRSIGNASSRSLFPPVRHNLSFPYAAVALSVVLSLRTRLYFSKCGNAATRSSHRLLRVVSRRQQPARERRLVCVWCVGIEERKEKER
jgi:hypothetical protein